MYLVNRTGDDFRLVDGQVTKADGNQTLSGSDKVKHLFAAKLDKGERLS